jgi:hypothetical protein
MPMDTDVFSLPQWRAKAHPTLLMVMRSGSQAMRMDTKGTPGAEMSDPKVDQLLHDLQLTHPDLHAIVKAARAVVRSVVPQASERVMYGGILFSAPEQFCGVFAYSAHVSMEFGQGAELKDPHGVFEGKGTFRRHIKLQTLTDIESKHLKDYIAQALRLSASSLK